MNPAPSNLARSARGLTLIEVLVALVVIAVLVAILLPAMDRARATGRTAVCMSNLRQTGVALDAYLRSHNGYIPGPNTSGYEPTVQGPTRPIMKGDWMSPLFGDALGLPDDRNQRMLALFNHDFRCPENSFTYDGMYIGGFEQSVYAAYPGWPKPQSTFVNSYASPLGFHLYDSEEVAQYYGVTGRVWATHPEDLAVETRAAQYRFRADQVGPPAEKVFAMDGSRYVMADGRLTFNVYNGNQRGGDNWINRSPVLNANDLHNGNPYKLASDDPADLHATSKLYTYRHPGHRVASLFFDGHVGLLDSAESRNPSFYYPSHSRVARPHRLTGPVDRDGVIR